MGFGNFNFFNRTPVESAPQEPEKVPEQKIKIFNDIQRKIIFHYEQKRGVTKDDSDEVRRAIDLEWVTKYAPEFALLRKELLQENPHLIDDYLEHPDQVSNEIEREVKIKLYHETPDTSSESDSSMAA